MNKPREAYILNEYGFTEQEAFDLENLIDRRGIGNVLGQITDICHAKAEHVDHAWQDRPLAMAWERLAHAIDKLTLVKAKGL